MLRKLLPLLVIGVWGITVVSLPLEASATTPLTRAEIEKIRNLVQLKPKNRQQRPARSSDAMFPGDGVSTGRASLAELRFNDRSLARVGEQAVFQFLPKTRNFKLSNGTVLLLIPPKQGRTRVQTPNAAAAIRGSALFVRYDEQTDTTVVGALTNSGIEVSNKDASQSRVLEAGQMLVIVKNRIQGLYEFDLRNFYERSDLVRGLDLARKTGEPSPDPAIAQVQEETVTALAAQKPIVGAGVIENPSFVKLTESSPTSPSAADNNIINNNSAVEPLVDIGQVLSNNDKKKDNSSGSTPITNPPITNPSVTTPPVTTPPVTTPPVTTPPVTTPPVTTPPITTPPVTPPQSESPGERPPVTTPPITTPPVTIPPVTTPPVTPPQSESPGERPPVTTPPITIPPVTIPPVTTPPVTTPPVTTPPVITPPQIESPTPPPVTTPPITTPPVTTPPITTPPVTTPPITTPPVTTPPVTTPPVITPPQIESPTPPPVTPPVTTPPVTPPVTTPPVTPPVTTPPVTTPPVTPPVTTPPVTTPPVTPPVKPST
ncbi:FecR domain-containing protein [Hassallia byssoidea VB512170]|uniref:FecR domain-containing protein n=1 Tax=Hassallia byssoidea VB512170 TaxID=1304833 RepID=A0A846HHQ1_9CYAN|nr:FecR domain-containing protein [Hassalia byssoidea]NEU76583.1 FecR domain-containing protein [Hassalia byssoidea VB512170]